MKRCPQCEFIYEDDQSLCDMDGALLVFDSRTLPNFALAPVELPIAAAPKAHWRHRTFPAMAALILATVFSLVYFVSTQRRVPAPPAVSGASIAVPASELPSPSDTNQTLPPPAPENNGAATQSRDTAREASETANEQTKPDSHKAPTPAPAKKVTSKTTESKRAEETKKDDSKVGSILKKTGRILKKPFKF
jgi:hypothetical protein